MLPLFARKPLGSLLLAAAGALSLVPVAWAQVGPTAAEAARYTGLHAAAYRGDVAQIQRLAAARADLNARDGHGRTPLHVATFARQREAIRLLAAAGIDDVRPEEFKRYGSARKLYNFHVDNAAAY